MWIQQDIEDSEDIEDKDDKEDTEDIEDTEYIEDTGGCRGYRMIKRIQRKQEAIQDTGGI